MRFQLAIPTIVFSAFSMAVNAGLNDDLIAYFPLNGNANDFIGTNNFVAYGGASLATDRQGRSDSAYFFDGVDDALVLTQGLIEARSSFSISVWFKPLQNDVLNQERTSGTFGYNQQYILGPSNHGDPVVGIGFSAGVNGISVFEHAHVHLPAVLVYEKDFGTNWVHAAITVESDGPPVLYINGVMVRTGLQSGRSKLYGQAVSTHQGFGGGGYGHFNGYIDEVRIYNRALSGIEIAELYHAESEIVISSFETNGEITFNNINTNYYYRVEWSANTDDLNGWRSTYTPLVDHQSTNNVISLPLPRFFRIVAGPQMLIPASTNVRAGAMIEGVSGTFWEGNRFEIGIDTNTIIDHKTRLMWPRDLRLGSPSGFGILTNWTGAVNFCDEFSLAGHSDWRLPTDAELASLCDVGFPLDNLLGNRASMTPLSLDYYFWSSTESGSNAIRRKVPGGAYHTDSKSANDNAVLPVRSITPFDL